MGGPGSGRKKGSKNRISEQGAAAKRVMEKRKARGASTSSIAAWKKGLIKRNPNLKGQI